MSEDRTVRFVRDVEVTCAGTLAAPHPPTVIALPPHGTIACDLCGQRYRRAPDWSHLTRANWPKAE